MKKILLLAIACNCNFTFAAVNNFVSVSNYTQHKEWKLASLDLKPTFTKPHNQQSEFLIDTQAEFPVDIQSERYLDSQPEQQPYAYNFADVNENAVKIKNGIKPYTFFQDQTFVGIPLFIAGVIAKTEKRSFRQNTADLRNSRTRLLTSFDCHIDDYSQLAPLVLTTGLNLAGVEGRSSFGRYVACAGLSYALMAGIVNPIKYGAKEMRPDGSTRNSFPSGHTATAFVSATILHKEYGMTRSPWYSIAGYGVATATGVMRVLNNRHWVSDVLSGAGIGIFSTELAYGIGDIIFKNHGLKREPLSMTSNAVLEPSFFSISMGMGLGSRNMTFDGEELGVSNQETNNKDVNLKFGTATVVGAEGAYFFNKYIGVGGRLRVKSSPIKGWSLLATNEREYIDNLMNTLNPLVIKEWIQGFDISVESDHITEFAADLGLYFNLPLSNRFALGTKALIGRSIIQDLDINAHAWGRSLDLARSESANPVWGNDYDCDWDYMTVSGNNTLKYGTGLSLTYAYKSNFSFKVFCDYDFTRKHYTMEYSPSMFFQDALVGLEEKEMFGVDSSTIKKNMNSFVLGGAFCVSF